MPKRRTLTIEEKAKNRRKRAKEWDAKRARETDLKKFNEMFKSSSDEAKDSPPDKK